MSGVDDRLGPSDERLADWVDGRMTPEERADYERWLAGDPGRMAEAVAYRDTVESVRGALRHGRHAPRDFASRVLDEARTARPSPELQVGARRFARIASVAAALILATTFLVVQRLNRARPVAEDVASGADSRLGALESIPTDLGFDAFFASLPEPDLQRAEPSRDGVGSAVASVTGMDGFVAPGEAPPIGLGGGVGGRFDAPQPGGGGGGGVRARAGSPGAAGPSTPGPGSAPKAKTAPQVLPRPSGPDSESASVGALVYVVVWPAPLADAEESRAPVAGRVVPDSPVAAGNAVEASSTVLSLWFEGRLQQASQDNVLILTADLIPLDLGPARLALERAAGQAGTPPSGEYLPTDRDRAFRIAGDAAQRERLLRTLLTAARTEGATLRVQRSRFRRLDLRAEERAEPGVDTADVVLVMRGLPSPGLPAREEQPAPKKRD